VQRQLRSGFFSWWAWRESAYPTSRAIFRCIDQALALATTTVHPMGPWIVVKITALMGTTRRHWSQTRSTLVTPCLATASTTPRLRTKCECQNRLSI
jgi:K+ transporter